MNIVKKQTDNLSAQAQIRIEEADYQNRVKKELNKIRVSAQVPGFRKGNVPMSRIQSLYGQSVLLDEVNKILQETMGKFLEDEKMDILGAPFPAENTPPIDLEHDKDFEFYLNIVLQPEVNIDFLEKLPSTYYKIKPTGAIVDEQITAIRQQFGSMDEANDVIQERDYLRCDYQSIDNESINGSSFFFIDEKTHPGSGNFIGHKINETFELDLDKIYSAEPDKAGNLLNLPSEELEKAKGAFTFTITSVRRKKEADLNEDLYKKVFPNNDIKNEKEFRDAVGEMHTKISAETVDIWFFNSLFEPIIEGAHIQYADEVLRGYIEHQKRVDHEHDENCDHCDEVTDDEFEKIKKGTSWELLQNKITQKYGIKLENSDLRQAAKEQVCRYFGADPTLDDEQLGYISGIVDNIMKEKDQLRQFYTAALDKKITQILKDHTQKTEKEITWEEFIKIAEADKEAKLAAKADGEKDAKKAKKASSKKEKSEAVDAVEQEVVSDETIESESKEKPIKKAASTKKAKKDDTGQTSLFEG